MKTRIIYTKFWYDNYISTLNPKEKLLFLYLITNEKINICGIYELPDKYILLDTGLTQKELNEAKKKFMKDSKFAFIDGWIKIINFDNYNTFTGEKNEKAKEKELSMIPEKVLNFKYPMDRGIDRVSANLDTLNNHNHNQYINHNQIGGIIKGGDGGKEEKIKYADYVSLTEKEYNKLIDKYGEDNTKKMITILDNYKGAKPNKRKYESDYRAILSWVAGKVTQGDNNKINWDDIKLGGD